MGKVADSLVICGRKENLYLSYDGMITLLDIKNPSTELKSVSFIWSVAGTKIEVINETSVRLYMSDTKIKWVDGWLSDVMQQVRLHGTYEANPRDPIQVAVHLDLELKRAQLVTVLNNAKNKPGFYITYDRDSNTYMYNWSANVEKSFCNRRRDGLPSLEFVDAYVIESKYIEVYEKAFDKMVKGANYVTEHVKNTRNSIGYKGKITNIDLMLKNCDLVYNFYNNSIASTEVVSRYDFINDMEQLNKLVSALDNFRLNIDTTKHVREMRNIIDNLRADIDKQKYEDEKLTTNSVVVMQSKFTEFIDSI